MRNKSIGKGDDQNEGYAYCSKGVQGQSAGIGGSQNMTAASHCAEAYFALYLWAHPVIITNNRNVRNSGGVGMASGTKGKCYLCGTELGKTAMKNHILKNHSTEDSGQDCMLLKIEGADAKDYWLYVDMPLSSSLTSLDSFLRKIWLECCGHMSAFQRNEYDDIGKSTKLRAFTPKDRLLHLYDFGDTTETLITVVGYVKRKSQRAAVRLLARNNPPEYKCAGCGKVADYICCECIWDSDNPFFCSECADTHGHECLLPVTNSPRMGVCGYTGELDTYHCPL